MNLNLIFAALSLAGAVWGAFCAKNKKVQKVDEALREWAPLAYDVVNDIVDQEGRNTTTKAALFTMELTDILKSKFIKVTPEIITRGAAIARAMHYQDKKEKEMQLPIVLAEREAR